MASIILVARIPQSSEPGLPDVQMRHIRFTNDFLFGEDSSTFERKCEARTTAAVRFFGAFPYFFHQLYHFPALFHEISTTSKCLTLLTLEMLCARMVPYRAARMPAPVKESLQ